MSGHPEVRLLLADVDGTLVTQDKVLDRRQRPGSCTMPELRLLSPAAGYARPMVQVPS